MGLISISESVGRAGRNFPTDVMTVAAALVAVGINRGGVAFPPTTAAALAAAIEGFQRIQHMATFDGRVDRAGATLRRINEILNPGVGPTPPPASPAYSGKLLPMRDTGDLTKKIDGIAWTPEEFSLASTLAFRWSGTGDGIGTVRYFELDEHAVPRWFGVVVPDGVTSFDRVHLFFHPLPAQAGYDDGNYHSLGAWSKIFHYLSDDMAVQFCASGRNRVLVMPLMTQGAANTCGMLPQRWEDLLGRMLGMVRSGSSVDAVPPVSISSMVVSSFSSGIIYSSTFRARSGIGPRLTGVIDFDGGFSSFAALSVGLTNAYGTVVRMEQMPATQGQIARMAAHNVFPLGRPRWSLSPYGLARNDAAAARQIHGLIPQTTMFIAARRAG